MTRLLGWLFLSFGFFASLSSLAAAPPSPAVPAAALPSAHFDARAATDAWLATVPQADRVKSDSYFEGGYWLLLWHFLANSAVMILLLQTGWSARMRAFAESRTSRRFLQWFLYWILFATAWTILLVPLTVYDGFFRERSYGLMNQSFGGWFRDALIGFALLLLFGGLAFTGLFAIVRKLPRTWPVWGTVASSVFGLFGAAIAPVFIMPLFNTYTSLKQPQLKAQILSLARANGIPATDVYQVDASRQSKRVSANVSGFGSTQRITLNDNLLARCSPPAVLSTMGHEMGHYVLNHIPKSILFILVESFVIFSLLKWGIDTSLRRWSSQWSLRDIGDPAVLPLAVLWITAITFVLTPVDNTFTRTQEYEADIFGLHAARQPDGEAEVDLLLGEYRKLDPSPLEEFIFFDHPSGRTRIFAAMRWKAENLCFFDASLPCSDRPAAFAVPAGGVTAR